MAGLEFDQTLSRTIRVWCGLRSGNAGILLRVEDRYAGIGAGTLSR